MKCLIVHVLPYYKVSFRFQTAPSTGQHPCCARLTEHMNSSDPIFDRGADYFNEEEHEAELQRIRLSLARERRDTRNRLRRQRMAAQDATMSSDSEMENLTDDVKNKMDVTPADSTPPELVKLDPSEIGMSVGYKHL